MGALLKRGQQRISLELNSSSVSHNSLAVLWSIKGLLCFSFICWFNLSRWRQKQSQSTCEFSSRTLSAVSRSVGNTILASPECVLNGELSLLPSGCRFATQLNKPLFEIVYFYSYQTPELFVISWMRLLLSPITMLFVSQSTCLFLLCGGFLFIYFFEAALN